MSAPEIGKELPKGWVRAFLGDVVTFEYGKGLPEAKREKNGKIPVYGSSGIVGYHSSSIVKEHSIVVGRKGAIGSVFLSDCPSWPIDTVYYITPPKEMNLKFVFYLLKTLSLSSLDKSTAIPGLNRNDAYKKKVLIPPFDEQRRIVGKVEELFSYLDAGVASLRTVKAHLRLYRQAVLKHAFEGKMTEEWRKTHKNKIETSQALLKRITEKRISNNSKWRNLEPIITADLPEIPLEWIWVRAQEVCENITNGYTPKGSDLHKQKGDIPFIKINNLTFNGKLDFSKNSTFIDRQIHEGMLRRSKVFPGDVLINIVGPPLGKVSIVPNNHPEWNINQAIVVFRPIEGYNRDFLALCLQSQPIISHLNNQAKATAGQFNVSVNMSRNLPIPLPTIEEQEKIVFEVKKNLDAIENTEDTLNKSLIQANCLRNSILKSAFEGNLIPQDPNDEPAGKLLERILTANFTNKANKDDKLELSHYVK